MRNLLKRSFFLLVCLLLAAGLTLPAFAAAGIDENADCSLTVKFQDEQMPVSGCAFDVYWVAELGEGTSFVLNASFAEKGLAGDDDILTQEEMQDVDALTRTLANYVASVQPYESHETDDEGTFRCTGLKPGLYLIVGEKTVVDESVVYTPNPILVQLPINNEGEWCYDVTAVIKFEKEPLPPEIEMIEHKVLKVWEDAGSEKDRPASITVNLLCDGEIYDTVTLTAESNWRYTWPELPSSGEDLIPYAWSASEVPVEGYTVSLRDEGITSVITNTRIENPTPPEDDDPDLPNTGLLWWPVPALLFAGLVLVIVGVVVYKKKRV